MQEPRQEGGRPLPIPQGSTWSAVRAARTPCPAHLASRSVWRHVEIEATACAQHSTGGTSSDSGRPSAIAAGTSDTGHRTPDNLTERQRRIVEEAASFCSDVLVDGWKETVADRANAYVTEPTWDKLVRGRRRRCRALADLAKAIFAGKKALHDLVGSFAAWLASVLGFARVEQQFARELATRIPLSPDAKLVAAARGVQVAGVLVCVANGDDLTRCQCFIDLALDEAKSRIHALLVAAMDDWQGLAAFRPRSGPLAAA